MNLSRRLAHTILAMCSTALVLTLTACGGGNAPETTAAATQSSTEAQVQTLKASDYFAASAGDRRVYGSTEAAWGSVEIITTQQTSAGTTTFVIDSSPLNSSNKSQAYLAIDADGLWSSYVPLDPTNRANADKLLPATFQEGDKFVQRDSTTSSDQTDANGMPYVVTDHIHTDVTIVGREDITTYAGVFKGCLKTLAVTTETITTTRHGVSTSSSPPTATQTTWYAPGFGVVKQTSDDGYHDEVSSGVSTLELHAYQIAGVRNELTRPTATVEVSSAIAGGAFVIHFSEPMLMASLTSDSIQIVDPDGQPVPFTTQLNPLFGPLSTANSVTITPDASYVPRSGVYQVKLGDKATDLAGNGLMPFEQSVDVTIAQMDLCCNAGAKIWLWAH